MSICEIVIGGGIPLVVNNYILGLIWENDSIYLFNSHNKDENGISSNISLSQYFFLTLYFQVHSTGNAKNAIKYELTKEQLSATRKKDLLLKKRKCDNTENKEQAVKKRCHEKCESVRQYSKEKYLKNRTRKIFYQKAKFQKNPEVQLAHEKSK